MSEKNYDELLFTSYQHSYIFEKAALLKGIIDNPVSIIDSIQGNDGIQFIDHEAVTSHLKAEIHFSMYHALESMFAMIFALIKQPNNVWKWLSTYNFYKFNKMIAEVADSNISVISEKSELETIEFLFFKNCPREFVEQAQTKNAMQTISKILTFCAKEMIDKSEYNSYKHGLRIISGDLRLKLVNENESINKTIDKSPGFVYLNTKNNESVRLVSKPYSFERSYKIIKLCWQLTSLLIKQRKLEYMENENCIIETIDFNQIDIDDIFVNSSQYSFLSELSLDSNKNK